MKNIKKFNELNTYAKLTNKERTEALDELEDFIEIVRDEISINNVKMINNMSDADSKVISQFDELINSYRNIKSKNRGDLYTNKLLGNVKSKHYGF